VGRLIDFFYYRNVVLPRECAQSLVALVKESMQEESPTRKVFFVNSVGDPDSGATSGSIQEADPDALGQYKQPLLPLENRADA
jgi:hypothetical protein